MTDVAFEGEGRCFTAKLPMPDADVIKSPSTHTLPWTDEDTAAAVYAALCIRLAD